MRAFAMVERHPGAAELVDIPSPSLGWGDVRIGIQAVGICGTDISLLDWASGLAARTPERFPLVMGHEGAGTVLEVGAGTSSVKPGDRVAPISIHFCHECWYCRRNQSNLCVSRSTLGVERDGVLAEQVVVREDRLSVLHCSVPLEMAALSDPLATVLQAFDRIPIDPDTTVAIVGAGTIGLMLSIVAQCFRPKRLLLIGLSIDRRRLALANGLGIDILETDEPGEVGARILRDTTRGRGADVVFEAAGQPDAVIASLQLLRSGGQLGLVGLSHHPTLIDTARVTWAEHTLVGIRGYSEQAWERGQRMMAKREIDLAPLVTHHVGLDEVPRAIEMVRAREALKVIVHPNGEL
jgi:threonine dehydrogenase-like Zn-dependent dehydrogenase